MTYGGPGGEANTGTNYLEPTPVKAKEAPYGYSSDGKAIPGPNSAAPFGYGPDGKPLASLDPRAPNGYGPDGQPLPGQACSAPYGLGLNGQPLTAPDPNAPFGYHPSDGKPVATNDPTAPFGYGRDGNPLSARDPNAPLGYGVDGQPNTAPETVSFCNSGPGSGTGGLDPLGRSTNFTNTSRRSLNTNGVQTGSGTGSQGSCDDAGVVYFARGGTNVIMSYDPKRVNDCQPPIRHMANAAGSGMDAGCNGGMVDVACVMQQAMQSLLSQVGSLLGNLGMQNGVQCPGLPQLITTTGNSGQLMLPQTAGQGLQPQCSEHAAVGTAGTGGFSSGIHSGACVPAPGLSPLDQQLPLTGTDYQQPAPQTGTGTPTSEAPVVRTSSGSECVESQTDLTGTASGEGKGKECPPGKRRRSKSKMERSKDADSGSAGQSGRNASGQRQRCIPDEMKQFVPGFQVGPDGKLPRAAQDVCNKAPPVPPRLGQGPGGQAGGSAALGQLCDAAGAGPLGARTVGKYLQNIAPQYQNLFDSSLTPEDQETLTLLTTVGTLLDTIEDTGLTRMDPVQLCSDKTLQNLTEVGEKMMGALKAHLSKLSKNPPGKSLDASDPFMAQIAKEAYDALEIGAESLEVAVGLLKDVITLCGEMADHPELLEKCAADIEMARQKNEDQMQDITNKQMTACQLAFQQLHNANGAATGTSTSPGIASGTGVDGNLLGDKLEGTQTDGARNVDEATGALSLDAKALGNQGISSSGSETLDTRGLVRTGNNPGPEGENANARGVDAGSGGANAMGVDTGSGGANRSGVDAGSDGVGSGGVDRGTDSNKAANLMGAHMTSVSDLLCGGTGTAGSQRIMFLTVSFLVGAAIGYAIANSYGLLGSTAGRLSELFSGNPRCVPRPIPKICGPKSLTR